MFDRSAILFFEGASDCTNLTVFWRTLQVFLYTVILGFVKNVLRGFPPLCRFSVLDGAACRLGGLGEVDDVRSVLGVVLVVPILLRGSCVVVEGRENEEDDVLVVRGK